MDVKSRLRTIVENNNTRGGVLFDLCIQALILISLVSFSIETLPTLGSSTRSLLRYIEIITVGIFTVEYFLRCFVAEERSRYIFSFFGLVDLLAIVPFYIASGLDLRSIRAFRMIRLFRILKFARYSKAIRRFHRAFLIAKEEMLLFLAVTVIVLYLSAVGIYYFENEAQPDKFASVFHSFWWAVATLTTVGYGDVYPITAGGKFFTFIVLIVGLGIVAVPAGLTASALSKAREEES